MSTPPSTLADEICARVGRRRIAAWLTHLAGRLGLEGSELMPSPARERHEVSLPEHGLRLSLAHRDAPGAAGDPDGWILTELRFHSREGSSVWPHALPFGLDPRSETSASAKEKLSHDTRELTRRQIAEGDLRQSFFLPDARVVQIVWSTPGSGIEELMVVRLGVDLEYGEDGEQPPQTEPEPEPESGIGDEVYCVHGCMAASDVVYLATHLEDIDPDEYAHTRLSAYVGRFEPGRQWFHHDVGLNAICVCVQRTREGEPPLLCALTVHGEIELFDSRDGSSRLETLPGDGDRSESLWYVRTIRAIGTHLFVCGMNAQVYRRDPAGWASLTREPLRHSGRYMPGIDAFNSIDGFSETDVYVVGNYGRVYHYDGRGWTLIPTPTKKALLCVRCYAPGEVWVAGEDGTVLRGDKDRGFEAIASCADKTAFHSLAKFRDRIYLSSYDRLFMLVGAAIEPVASGLQPEIESGHLDSNAERLWIFGEKDLVFFDGAAWSRVGPPDAPPPDAGGL